MTVMVALLRRHGATMVERHGRAVAAHFGSAAAEAAVARKLVGLAERSDRATLEVRGAREDVDRALGELASLGERARVARVAAGHALVRCDGADEGACASAMLRSPDAWVHAVSGDYAAIELIGPLSREVLRVAGVVEEDRVVTVDEGDGGVELLVARTHGPALWNRLLEAGEPLGIACVGVDALEHLAVSEHLARAPAEGD